MLSCIYEVLYGENFHGHFACPSSYVYCICYVYIMNKILLKLSIRFLRNYCYIDVDMLLLLRSYCMLISKRRDL